MKRNLIPKAVVEAAILAGREGDLDTLNGRCLFGVYLQWHGIIGFTEDLWELSARLHAAEVSEDFFATAPPAIQSLSLPGVAPAPLEDRCAEVIVDLIIASGPQPIESILMECRNELADYSPGYALRALRQLQESREVEWGEGRYSLPMGKGGTI